MSVATLGPTARRMSDVRHRIRHFFAVITASCVVALAGAAQASATARTRTRSRPRTTSTDPRRGHLPPQRGAGEGEGRVAALGAGTCSRPPRGTADDMVTRQFFAHDTPDGINPFDRMRRAGYISSRDRLERRRDDRVGVGHVRDAAQHHVRVDRVHEPAPDPAGAGLPAHRRRHHAGRARRARLRHRAGGHLHGRLWLAHRTRSTLRACLRRAAKQAPYRVPPRPAGQVPRARPSRAERR